MVDPVTAAAVLPLLVVLPVTGACVVLGAGRWLPGRLVELLSLLVAAASLVLDALMLAASGQERIVDWAGGWRPAHGISVGIALVADQVAAGLATLAAALVVAAIVYSWRYFEDSRPQFHGLLLFFLAGMTGFAIAGDIFTMFVFFELMSVAAYALTGMKIEDPTAVQGAINFGVVNSLAAYISLLGVGTLYARYGQLNLAELSRSMAHDHGVLVVVGFVLVCAGFLVKAAVVPFHFWLDDAHAAAPTPACILFSGVMVELGLYGVARIYWVVFDGPIARGTIQPFFLVLGVLTAAVGTVMCVLQRHLKRLLAFSTIGHVGMFFVILAIGGPAGSGADAGGALIVYVLGHAAIKGALFLLAGILLNRFGSVDEFTLHGRGRRLRTVGALYLVAGLALAGLPPFAAGLGKSMADTAEADAGLGWAPWVLFLASAVTAGAILRAGLRVFLGLGRSSEQVEPEGMSGDAELIEVRIGAEGTPASMLLPPAALLACALVLGILPGVASSAAVAAGRMMDGAAYAAAVLDGRLSYAGTAAGRIDAWSAGDLLVSALTVAAACAIAVVAVSGGRARSGVEALSRALSRPLRLLRQAHSGHVGDYIVWLCVGLAVMGFGLLAATAPA